MSGESIPGTPLSSSSTGTSRPVPQSEKAQLSAPAGVHSNVSSVAIDRGLLAMSGAVPDTKARYADSQAAEAGSDAEVMLRVKAGDDSAFAYLVQKYRRAMVGFMYRMAHNPAAAEDLAQEVFLRVYRSRENYQPSAKFTTWLYRIASNLAANYARDTRHERPENMVSIDEKDDDTGLTVDVPDGSLTAEETIMRRERMAAIREKVRQLPERQRVAVIMHKYQQMDYRQIAEVLKLSESATKSLLFRAYETLRVQLKEFI
ncbi:MAG TPA: sigma-70 family RNA polymerase sigma factor [Terriglobales bacterium]|nr:sigma-70 family RNA polymerase sigma factor [Terriglobales bacterium]